jgi:isopenicillin N synthase-like dioxygenase
MATDALKEERSAEADRETAPRSEGKLSNKPNRMNGDKLSLGHSFSFVAPLGSRPTIADEGIMVVIPTLDIAPLFGPAGMARDAVDRALLEAATKTGFLIAIGFLPEIPVGDRSRSALARIFTLAEPEKRRLWRRKFAPDNWNVYRGYFPVQNGAATYKEGIDLGPDLSDPDRVRTNGDPLLEPTPFPDERSLPGWRDQATRYYRAMEHVAGLLMASLARGLGIDEAIFAAPFACGISTLRLIHYPLRPPESVAGAEASIEIEHEGKSRQLVGAPHTDSGILTLLNQDATGGLQARSADGRWLDVPPQPRSLVVNFGQLLELWTGGRVRATEHRVLAAARPRISIPFFFEPGADALIQPLAPSGRPAAAPFRYGDYLWQRMVNFVEFRGLERRPACH